MNEQVFSFQEAISFPWFKSQALWLHAPNPSAQNAETGGSLVGSSLGYIIKFWGKKRKKKRKISQQFKPYALNIFSLSPTLPSPFLLLFLKQSLAIQPNLALSSDSLASAPQVLGLQVCTTSPDFNLFSTGSKTYFNLGM